MYKIKAVATISCFLIFLNGCAMMFMITHMPKEEIVLYGKTNTQTGTMKAVVKKCTFKSDKRFNMEGGIQLYIEVTNDSLDILFLKEYVITKTDTKKIIVNFSDLKPTVISTTGERFFDAKSHTFFNIPVEPLLSLIQFNKIDKLTLIFEDNTIVLYPKY